VFGLDASQEFEVGLAGPLNVAFGLEARRETFQINAGEVAPMLAARSRRPCRSARAASPASRPATRSTSIATPSASIWTWKAS
jgi:hypothetical protein